MYKLHTYTVHTWFPDDSEDYEQETIDENELEFDRLTDVFRYLQREGIHEASSSPTFHPGVWYSRVDSETRRTFKKGGSEETTYHLDRRTPVRAQKALWNALISEKVLRGGYKRAS